MRIGWVQQSWKRAMFVACLPLFAKGIWDAQSILPHAGNQGIETEIEDSEKAAATVSQPQETSGLSYQCSATKPQHPDNHQIS